MKPAGPRLSAVTVLRWRMGEPGPALGLPLAALLAASLCLALWVFFGGGVRPEQVTGRIEGFGLVEDQTGGAQLARVVFPGGEATVFLSMPNTCAAGGPIRLLRFRRPWGSAIRADRQPCSFER